jgi:ribosomal protein L20A (L18A)
MYKEYRELTKADAVTACYRDMASRHRVRSRSLHIISVDSVQAKDTRRTNIKQFHVRPVLSLLHVLIVIAAATGYPSPFCF